MGSGEGERAVESCVLRCPPCPLLLICLAAAPAGLLLLSGLGKLTLRLCDPTQGHATAAEGRDIVAQMMAFLLAEGVTHPVKDAKARVWEGRGRGRGPSPLPPLPSSSQAACLGYLRDLSKSAGPLLRPHLPALLYTALASMGDQEHAGLAHVQARGGRGVGGFDDGGEGTTI